MGRTRESLRGKIRAMSLESEANGLIENGGIM